MSHRSQGESPLGAVITKDGVHFRVFSRHAEQVWLCLFDGEKETARLPMLRDGDDFVLFVKGLRAGQAYGFRADGPEGPRHHFDPSKLLADPAALALDRPWRWDPALALPRSAKADTAWLVPRALVTALPAPPKPQKPLPVLGGLIYELGVRSFTKLHPDIPEQDRGTLSALAHPAVIAHLKNLGVAAVELMPVTAWIDERHLPPLGLSNAWGYNPVTFMALDPRLAPGGIADLRLAVEALHAAGIGVILDIVFNHTGESDVHGGTLSLRGLDNAAYFRHDSHGNLINDTGCGNTLACHRAPVVRLMTEALRHFVIHAGIDGFRFDLAPILARRPHGFDPGAPFLKALADDPVLADRILIAEPWDIGPGGYQLGKFPENWLEWNDRARDDIRRFWRGDFHMSGALATRLAGSSDIFGNHGLAATTRSINFIAAHDGFPLADLARYRFRHNHANGENNRDGHTDNLSWNCGIEGETADFAILAARSRDARALIATLFATRGTLLLTAGDEFGRSQRGNNNAYAQYNPLTWLDWAGRDRELEAFTVKAAKFRAAHAAIGTAKLLNGKGRKVPDVLWFSQSGLPMDVHEWEHAERRFLGAAFHDEATDDRVALVINGDGWPADFHLPKARRGKKWRLALASTDCTQINIAARGLAWFEEL